MPPKTGRRSRPLDVYKRQVLPFGIGQRRLNRLFDRGRIVAEGGRLHLVGLRHVEVHDMVELVVIGIIAVSYTHLDVYKRQVMHTCLSEVKGVDDTT